MAGEKMADPQMDMFPQPKPMAGGGFEGASQVARAVSTWYPSSSSADQIILDEKELLDARSEDMVRNDGYASGAAGKYKDSIVGSQFKLNAMPDFLHLGFSVEWAEEFEKEVESKFTLWAESHNNWVDASGVNNFTDLIRLAISGPGFASGEIIATAEWIRDGRPYNTAIQMIDPARLSNPHGRPDTQFMRGGKEKNKWGRTLRYWIQQAHPQDYISNPTLLRWKGVPATKPWGRKQVIYLLEQSRIDQSRGVGQMVQALKSMRTRHKLTDVELQNVVLNAMYAASLESDLPAEVAASIVGGAGDGDAGTDNAAFKNLVAQQQAYYGGKNVYLDGVKMPVLPPGTKMKLQRASAAANPQFSFEKSLLREMARSLGMSYEEFSGDFTETNYSSARAAMGETWKMYQGMRSASADRFATEIYALWLEEAISKGHLKSLSGFTVADFNTGLNKDALIRCSWMGAPKPEIDPKKEREADNIALKNGTMTFEEVCAKRSKDWRDVFRQRAKENNLMVELGLVADFGSNGGGGGQEAEDKPRTKDGKFGTSEEDTSDDDTDNQGNSDE
jgi:lambda family phage portal protein